MVGRRAPQRERVAFLLVSVLQRVTLQLDTVGGHTQLVLAAERDDVPIPDPNDLTAQHTTATQHQDPWLRRELGLIGLIDAPGAQDQNDTSAKRPSWICHSGGMVRQTRISRKVTSALAGLRGANYIGGRRREARLEAGGCRRGNDRVMGRELREVWYSGHVQGVGFRYTVLALARRSDVTGYVRNLPDGRVHLVVEGDVHELDEFLEALAERMQGYIRDTLHGPSTGDWGSFASSRSDRDHGMEALAFPCRWGGRPVVDVSFVSAEHSDAATRMTG